MSLYTQTHTHTHTQHTPYVIHLFIFANIKNAQGDDKEVQRTDAASSDAASDLTDLDVDDGRHGHAQGRGRRGRSGDASAAAAAAAAAAGAHGDGDDEDGVDDGNESEDGGDAGKGYGDNSKRRSAHDNEDVVDVIWVGMAPSAKTCKVSGEKKNHFLKTKKKINRNVIVSTTTSCTILPLTLHSMHRWLSSVKQNCFA